MAVTLGPAAGTGRGFIKNRNPLLFPRAGRGTACTHGLPAPPGTQLGLGPGAPEAAQPGHTAPTFQTQNSSLHKAL